MTLLIMDDEIVALQGVGTILIKAGVKVISFIEKNIYTEKDEKVSRRVKAGCFFFYQLR